MADQREPLADFKILKQSTLQQSDIDLDDITHNAQLAKLSNGEGAFVNLGFSEDDDRATLSTLQAEAKVTTQSLESSLEDWNKYLSYIQQNKHEVKTQIEQQRDEIIKLINEQAQSLISQTDALIESHEQQAIKMRETLQCTMGEVREFVNTEIELLLNNNQNTKVDQDDLLLKHCGFLVRELQNIRKKTFGTTPLWLPLKLYTKTPTEYLTSHLFGTVRLTDNKDYPLKYCEPLQLLKRMCTRTKYDQMPGGIVDMCISSTGSILVCDKQNKMLKMFNRDGSMEKVICSGNLKDPNRITNWPHNNGFIVNDNYIRFIKLYDLHGEYVSDFCNSIKCPTSLCVNHRGELLVTEYESKTILVLDPNGERIFSFKTQMAAQAHVNAGPRGHIVVTDWRHNVLKVFQVTGECQWAINEKGSGDLQLDQPQGTCFDPFGNILVADANNHRIQCFTDNGDFVKTIISKSAGLKLPIAVHCDANGYLYVAEYSGFVKIFKYLQHEDQTQEQSDVPLSSDNSPSKRSTPVEDETAL